MGGHPLKKIDTHSTAELKKMSANELIREARKAIEASDHSFDWFKEQQTAIFFGKRKRTHQMEQAMHAAYEAGDYARRYYHILRDVFLWKQGFPLEDDQIGDISDPCIRIFGY